MKRICACCGRQLVDYETGLSDPDRISINGAVRLVRPGDYMCSECSKECCPICGEDYIHGCTCEQSFVEKEV